MKHLSMTRFATLWTTECDWEPDGKYCIKTYEPLETDAPESSHPSCSSYSITFYDRTGNKQTGKVVNCHSVNGVAPDMWLVGDRWYEMTCGEVLFVKGRWNIVRTGYSNGRLARMMNKGWFHYKK